ncbi:SdrD B-like domain-containing protein [Lewinella sp. 4G2]|uniref:SdrD B-like domain-containing protein n=1 Tax=Lewinella sp. 4G2 TaxID=1803372 RepID=UPI0012F9AA1C|nr:SdrD B-like domain-containing protein [Lewinella sp. 4G2]
MKVLDTFSRGLFLFLFTIVSTATIVAQDSDMDGISDAAECAGTTSTLSMDGNFAGATATNVNAGLNLTRTVGEGPSVGGTFNNPVSTTITFDQQGNDVSSGDCDFTISSNGRFDDGLQVEVDGTVILQFNFFHWGSQPAFRGTGKFNTNSNGGTWTPWTNEGNPVLNVRQDGTIELLVDTRGGGRENALDDMRTSGTGNNDWILNPAPLTAADCSDGIDVVVRQSNQNGPGRRPGVTIAASIDVCTDTDGDGTNDADDPCFPGPQAVLESSAGETECLAQDGAATLRVDNSRPGETYSLVLTNNSTGEVTTATATGNPPRFVLPGLQAGNYSAEVTNSSGVCTVEDLDFTIGGDLINPGSISTSPALWLRADVGVNAGGALPQVQRWMDQSPSSNDAISDGSDVAFVTTGDGMNFNPSVAFDPTLDPDGRLFGDDPLGFTDASGNMTDFTFFIVPRITDEEGGNCGDDVFNFFDNENLFEVENFVPKDGCESFVNNFTYGIFNGGESALLNTENRTSNIIGLDYAQPGGSGNFNTYGRGVSTSVTQINNYRNPVTGPNNPYSLGQALFNRTASDQVAPVEVGEVIAFPGVLSQTEREIVNSYLAIKYGINLDHNYLDGEGNVVWDRDGNRGPFSNAVFGLGRNDCGNFEQRQSRSALGNAELTIGNGEIAGSNADNPNQAAADMSYLVVGSNGERPGFGGRGGNADWRNRNARVYKVSEFVGGTPGDAYQDLDLRFSRVAGVLPDGPAGTFALLIDRDGDGDFSNAETIDNATFDTDGNLLFEGVDLDHDDCFSLARPTCEVDIMSIISGCQNGNEFDLEVNIDYTYLYNSPATPGTIVVIVDGEEFFSDPLTSTTGTTTVTFNITGSFIQEGLIARFTTDDICTDAEILNLQSCDLACIAQPDAITGLAYPDYNLNGIRDVGEGALPGATVNIYDCDGNLVGTDVTGFDGTYAIDGLDPSQNYRVEFVPDPNTSTVNTYADADNPLTTTDVIFADAGSCNVNIGTINPDYCKLEDLQYVTACFTRLNPAQNPNADVVISFQGSGGANSSNPLDYLEPRPHPVNLGVGEVGPINGIAFDRRRQLLYMSTTVKAETSFPAGGSIADIYVADNSTNDDTEASVNSATSLVNLDTDCGINVGTYRTDFGTPALNDGVDDQIFEDVGKVGIGDIDLSGDGSVLYATNLFNRTLIVLPLDEGTAVCGSSLEVAIPEPPSCAGKGVVRPWAIGRRSGFPDIYVGAVCDASISNDIDDLWAFVFRFDPATNTFDPTPVLDFPLDYPRQTNFARRLEAEWLPWVDTRDAAAARAQNIRCCGNTYFVVHPQPILSDIEFDRGDMVVGLMDRFANQLSQIPSTSPKKFSAGNDFILPCGDVLRAGFNANDTWTIEDDGMTNGVITGMLPASPINKNFTSPDILAGPGGDEFYWQDDYRLTADHYETALGAFAQVPGQLLAVNAWDPVRNAAREYGTGGVNFFNNNNGSWVKAYKLYGGVGPTVPGNFGKGAGFGDIEPICRLSRIQIGNFVFADRDEDGIQDGCDEPLAGVPVALFAPDGTLRATTVTNASGQYYFSSDFYDSGTWVDPQDSLAAGEEVVIVFGYDANAPAASPFDPVTEILSIGTESYTLTLQNEGTSDGSDSDAGLTSAAGQPWDGYPFIETTLGQEQTNFTFDAGFIPQDVDLALRKDFTPNGQVFVGDPIQYDIRVINQGTKPLRTVTVSDNAGSGLVFDQTANQNVPITRSGVNTPAAAAGTATWSTPSGGASEITVTVPGTLGLAPGDTLLIPINFTVGRAALTDGLRYVNTAEVSGATDLRDMEVGNQDIDSTPDQDPTNDGGGRPGTGTDGSIDGDGSGDPEGLNPNTDEDDSDVERLPIIDVALTKNVEVSSLGTDGLASFGETIEFFITVSNQGTAPVTTVEIFDNIPCAYTAELANGNLLPQNADWMGSDETGVRTVTSGLLRPGQSTRVSLFLTLINPINSRPGCGASLAGDPFTNVAEISLLTDQEGNRLERDLDSDFDEGDNQEDGGGIVNDATDNVVDGDGTGTSGSNDPLTDDDDQDVADVNVIDVALRKYQDETQAASMTQFNFQETAKFQIALISQGNVPVDAFDVVDYLPIGLEYNAALNDPLGWSYDPGTRQATLTGVPAPDISLGDSVRVCIYADVVNTSLDPADFINRAEITRFSINPQPNPNLPGAPTLAPGFRTRDADSQQDNNPDNDPGGEVNTPDDNNVAGLGLAANEDEDDADPAQVIIIQPVTIGDAAFIDVDMNDVQSAADLPAAGVTVTITNSDGSPVTQDILGNPYDASLVTDMNGQYVFDSLPPGNYVITFDFTTITSGNPDLYEPVAADAGAEEVDSDAGANGVTPPTGPLTSGDTVLTVDAGVVCNVSADALGAGTAAPVICETETLMLASLNASVQPASLGGVWATRGDGTFNAAGNFATSVTYTPGPQDIANESVWLILRNNFPPASSGCEADVDSVLLTINDVPEVDAGADQTICADQTASISATVSGGATTGQWTTSGSGTFADAAATSTTYTPNTADVAAGSVTLTFTTEDPSGPCPAASDALTLTVNEAAEVDAGPDQTVCENDEVQLAGSFGGGATGASWSGGSGTYAPNAQDPTAVYTPSESEVIGGSVTLTLSTLDPAGPCPGVEDKVTITINSLPQVEAGAPQTICSDGTAQLGGTVSFTGSGSSGGSWSTNATAAQGTLTDNGDNTASFTPAAGATGDFTFTFTADDPDGAGPCVGGQTDEVVVTVNDDITSIDASDDQTICSTGTATITATVNFASGASGADGVWSVASSTAAGTISQTVNGSATFTPAEGETGMVTFTFTARDPDGNGPCSGGQTVQTTVTVNDNVDEVEAGNPQTICADETATLSGTVTLGSGAMTTDGTWSTTATAAQGTLTNGSNGTATFTPAEGAFGTFDFTFTANDPDGADPCVGGQTDNVTITVNDDITDVEAGEPQNICSDATATLSGTVNFASGATTTNGTWSTTATAAQGTLNNGSNGTATFDPATGVTGDFTFTFTARDPDGTAGPCAGGQTDEVVVTVNDDITDVEAGPAQTICSDGTANLSGTVNFASGAMTMEGTWSTTATAAQGTLTDNGDGTATFDPADGVVGDFTFTFTAADPDGAGPCVGDQMDDVIITVNDDITDVEAGEAQTICSDGTADLSGIVNFASGATTMEGSWSTTATAAQGTLTDNGNGTATFDPADGVVGDFTFTFTADDPDGTGPCMGDQTDNVVVTVNDDITDVEAGEAQTICSDGMANLSGTVNFASGATTMDGVWSTTATAAQGTLTDNGDGTATFDPADGVVGDLSFTFTADDPDGAGPCAGDQTDGVVITINDDITDVEAGEPQTICSDGTATLSGTVNFASGATTMEGAWSTTATAAQGTLTDNGDGTATFDPADGVVGDFTFTFTADDPDGTGPCAGDQTDEVVVTVNDDITDVEAGEAQTICSDGTADLSGTVNFASGATTMEGTWSTTTTPAQGTLTDNGDGTATFDPADGVVGDLTFTFTADDPDGTGPCVGDQTDDVIVTVNDDITDVEAGEAQTICSDGTATLSGTVNFASGATTMDGTWSTTATAAQGTLTDNGDGTATFDPADGVVGDLTFTFTADDPDGTGPCAGDQTDDVVVTVNDDITDVEAGEAQTICSDGTADFSGTVNFASGATTMEGSWSTTATAAQGTLTDNGDGTATFDPADGVAGDFTFTFTADDPDGTGPCVGDQTDDVVVTVNDDITDVEAGDPQTICSDGTADLSGTVNFASGATTMEGIWSTTATAAQGTLTDNGDGTAIFDPADGVVGDFTFTFTADDPDGTGPCVGDQTDDVIITVNDDITDVEAGDAQTICSDGTATLSGTVNFASGETTTDGAWSTTATAAQGTLTDNGDGTATFDPADGVVGDLTFTFTADDPDGTGPCVGDQTDEVIVTVNDDITDVEAGEAQTICSDGTATVSGTVNFASGATTMDGAWSTTATAADGTLTDNGDGTATFDPANGVVGDFTFTFTANDPDGTGPCVGDQPDEVIVTVNDDITDVEAGTAQTICADATATLSGTVNFASGATTMNGTWSIATTTATGMLSTTANGVATYTPGPGETGDVNFTFTAADPDDAGPCAGGQTDQVTVTINNSVVSVNAGMDQTICPEDLVSLSGSVNLFDGTSTTAGEWSTSGTGTLTNGSDGTATYQPTAVEMGTLTFTFTADDSDGAGPCVGGQTDEVIVTIRTSPVVTVADQEVCAESTTTFTAVATASEGGTLSYQWQDNGSGTFEDIFNETNATLVISTTPLSFDGRQYRVVVTETTNGLGCPVEGTAMLMVNPLPGCLVTGPVVVGTNQQDVEYSAPAGLDYAWSISPGVGASIDGPTDQQTLTVDFGTEDVTIFLTVTDANGCSRSCQLNTGVASLSIGSTVFEDLNNNGIQDAGEPGIPGVEVQLFDANGNQFNTGPDGALNTGDEQDPTPVLTDADGFYFFGNLFPGDYVVTIPVDNFTTGRALDTINVSSNNLTSGFVELDPDAGDVDGDDNGLQPGGLATETRSLPVTLSVDGEPTAATTETGTGSAQDDGPDDASGNMTVDFGFFAPVVEVGDFVFVDVDGDGQQGSTEPGLTGVTVTLFNGDGTPVEFQSDGTNPYPNVVMTDADGRYSFPSLPPGDYYVTFDLSTADNADLYTYTNPNFGNDATDSDAVSQDGVNAQSGTTDFLQSGEADLTLDAGVICNLAVTVAEPSTICGTQPIDLSQGASLQPASLGGFWTTNGDGRFLDANGQVLTAPFIFGDAVTYRPGRGDAARGSVTFTLSTNDPGQLPVPSVCEPVSASVTIQVLRVDCGQFFWDGQ